MLLNSDVPIELFESRFSKLGLDSAFLVPTATGLGKSITDAIEPLRDYLRRRGVHNYETQGQGEQFKVKLPCLYYDGQLKHDLSASLYRPETKAGDPRIWFSRLHNYAAAGNLLAILADNDGILVLNCSTIPNRNWDDVNSELHSLLTRFKPITVSSVLGIVDQIRAATNGKFVPSIGSGSRAIGETLERLLGISANPSKLADIAGVELKVRRLKRPGLMTLFCEKPEFDISPFESLNAISEKFAYKDKLGRLALRINVKARPPNKRTGLFIRAVERTIRAGSPPVSVLDEMYTDGIVASWRMSRIRERIAEKLARTLTVHAEIRETNEGIFYRYVRAESHGQPDLANLPSLFNENKLIINHRALFNGARWEDKGLAFRMYPRDLGLLLPGLETFDLAA